MNVFTDLQTKDIAQLDPALLVNAIKALQELTWSAQSDIYSDAPECVEGVCRVETAVQAAYEVLIQIREVLDVPSSVEPRERIDNCIPDETEEAFKVKCTAIEGANRVGWPELFSIEDCPFGIEVRTQTQDLSSFVEDDREEVTSDTQSLKDLTDELQALFGPPSPTSRDYLAREGGKGV